MNDAPRRLLVSIAAVLFLGVPFTSSARTVDLARALPTTPAAGTYFEIPFWVVMGGARQLTVTTGNTYACWTSSNPVTDIMTLPSSQCTLVLGPWLADDWSRNYQGAFSAHVLNAYGSNQLTYLAHGENKNECVGGTVNADGSGCTGTCYQTTVSGSTACSACADGYTSGGAYIACWPAYNAFINQSWQYYDSSHNWGMQPHFNSGPILWPANGYTYGGAHSSSGARHPRGLVDGSYLYAFYVDESFGTGTRGKGIKVARAPISTGGSPGTWKTYCSGSWVDSLPSGFTKSTMSSYYATQGGCATSIIPDVGTQVTFAVARNTLGGYLGVEERVSGGYWELRLYTSTDLTTWTYSETLRSVSGTWSAGDLHYPAFLSADGTSNEVVDGNHFSIVGTAGTNNLRLLHVHN